MREVDLLTLSNKIEKVQKIALYVILGNHAHKDYVCNQAILNIESLEDRRTTIAKNFATKILKHPEHQKIFNITVTEGTRSGKRIVEPFTRRARYAKSTIPSLAKMINNDLSHKL